MFTLPFFFLLPAVFSQQEVVSPTDHRHYQQQQRDLDRTRKTLSGGPPIDEMSPITGGVACNFDNEAAGYPCDSVDLESFVPLAMLTGGNLEVANDVWGWTNEETGVEYAIVGTFSGTSFTNLSNPSEPKVVGFLPSSTTKSSYGDIKTYGNYAFKVSEALGHGMQIIDMSVIEDSGIDDPSSTVPILTATAHYSENGLGNANNMFVNVDSGYAYIVGCFDSCNAGLHMVDIAMPLSPNFVGCFSQEGRINDVQCVMYDGPDKHHNAKREICFASSEVSLLVIDVTDKQNPSLISKFRYSGVRYMYQGRLTDDHRYFLISDKDDKGNTKTYIVDVSNLDRPILSDVHVANYEAIDRNIIINDFYAYQTHLRAGMRIFDLIGISDGVMTEVGYFDIYPEDNDHAENGAWGVFPLFESGIVLVSGIEQGLYVLRPQIASRAPTVSPAPTLSPAPTKSPSDTEFPTPGIGVDDAIVQNPVILPCSRLGLLIRSMFSSNNTY